VALRALVEQHPELFASWQTVAALAQVAEHQTRVRGQALICTKNSTSLRSPLFKVRDGSVPYAAGIGGGAGLPVESYEVSRRGRL
jgi:hypothetical protein